MKYGRNPYMRTPRQRQIDDTLIAEAQRDLAFQLETGQTVKMEARIILRDLGCCEPEIEEFVRKF